MNLDSSAILMQIRQAATVSRMIYCLNIVLCCGLLWGSAVLAARVIEHEVLKVPFVTAHYVPPAQTKTDRTRGYSDFKSILKDNIFDAEVTAAKEPEITNAPMVTSEALNQLIKNWMLTGVYAGSSAYCFIQNRKTASEDMFGEGDILFGTRVRVSKIITSGETPKVYVKRGNELGVLEYPKEKRQILMTSLSQKRGNSVSNNVNPYSSDGRTFRISSSEVDHHLNNFSKLLNQARVVPYFQNGKNIGYKIKAIDKGSLYEKLGLVNNDIIQRVNGETIDSPEKAFQLLKALRNEREINLNLLRGNAPMSLTYYIE